MNHFLQGKQTFSAPSLKPVPPTPGSIACSKPADGKQRHDHNVEVVKEGDKVTRIIVTCTCGEVIEIECLYPAGS